MGLPVRLSNFPHSCHLLSSVTKYRSQTEILQWYWVSEALVVCCCSGIVEDQHVTTTSIVVRFASWLQRQLGAKRRPLQRNPWDTQLKVRYPVISERLLKFIEFPIGFQLRKFSLRAYPPDLSRKIEGPLLAGYCVRHSVSRMLLFISAGYCSHSWN